MLMTPPAENDISRYLYLSGRENLAWHCLGKVYRNSLYIVYNINVIILIVLYRIK